MSEPHLVAEAVPRIADVLPEAAWHAHHDRRGEPIRGPPPHRSTVVQLLRRGIGILAELNLGDGHQAADRHANGPADNPFLGETGVEDASVTELPLQTFGDEMDATLPTDVLTKDDTLRIHLQLMPQSATHCFGEADDFHLLLGVLARLQRRALLQGEAAEQCWRVRLLEDESPHRLRISGRSRARLSQTLI